MNDVEAIKSKDQIAAVTALLRKENNGDLYADIWKVGLNLSLRISDLLSIQFDHLDMEKRLYSLVEGKTGKKRDIRLNDTVLTVVQRRKKLFPEDTYLFQVHSNRAKNAPISRISVSRKFKDVGDRLGLSLNTHSMRKTRGWAMFEDGVPIERISKVLNHSSPAVTMRYIGITKQEILDSYDQYEL